MNTCGNGNARSVIMSDPLLIGQKLDERVARNRNQAANYFDSVMCSNIAFK